MLSNKISIEIRYDILQHLVSKNLMYDEYKDSQNNITNYIIKCRIIIIISK